MFELLQRALETTHAFAPRDEARSAGPTVGARPEPQASRSAPPATRRRDIESARWTPVMPAEDLVDAPSSETAIGNAEELAGRAGPVPDDALVRALERLEGTDRLLQEERAFLGASEPRLSALHARLRVARQRLVARRQAVLPQPDASLAGGDGAARRGDRMVAAASAWDELASDDESFTAQLVRALAGDREASFLDTITSVAQRALRPHPDARAQHPTLAVAGGGASRATIGAAGTGRKATAVYVANAAYPTRPLRGTIPDAEGLNGAMSGRGFQGAVHTDRTAAQMGALYEGAAADASLEEGDSLLLFFSGHGLEEGLAGVDYGHTGGGDPGVLPHARVNAMVKQASARGVNTSVVIDACHSGTAVDQMRNDQMQELVGATRGTDLAPLMEMAREIDGAKVRFGRSLLEQRPALAAARSYRDADPGDGVEHQVARIVFDDLKADLRRLASRFTASTGQALKTMARIEALQPETGMSLPDLVDDLTNEVLAYVESQRVVEDLRRKRETAGSRREA